MSAEEAVDHADPIAKPPIGAQSDTPDLTNISAIKNWLTNSLWPAFLSKWTLFVGFVVFAIVLLFAVRPFDTPQGLASDNVALVWNATIERLGMQPLYPPQEDFFVGDVYITLEDPETEIAGQKIRYPSNVYKGRGVRIGHIDMKESIVKGTGTLLFADTKMSGGKATVDQPRSEVRMNTDFRDLINLSLVSFPGISVKRRINADAGFWNFFANRWTGEVEEISIPYAESYGAPVVDSTVALGKYCSEKATAGFCTDVVARKILSYAFGRDVNAIHDKQYIFPITISVIGQVFLTRQLEIDRYG